MRNRQSGFSLPMILFAAVVIFVISLTGLLIYNGREKHSKVADEVTYPVFDCNNGIESGIRQGLQMGYELNPHNITILTSRSLSPHCTYEIEVSQQGDAYMHRIHSGENGSHSMVADSETSGWSPVDLPGYNKDWSCMCAGPEFVGWSSDAYFVAEFRANSMDGQKLLYYHMNINASNGEIVRDSFKLVKSE